MNPIQFVALLLLALSDARVMRGGGIDGVSMQSDGTVSQPTSSNVAVATGTPDPYQTYSAAWSMSADLGWTPIPNANVFDTSAISKLTVDNMGPNFKVILTAIPSTRMPSYWIVKTEPGNWSIEDHRVKKIEHWDGVRNYQANNNMKKMKLNDYAFMYHSVSDRQIVGVLKVVREHYPDHTDATGKFGMVDFEYIKHVKDRVHLEEFKSNPVLQQTALVKQGRLSVIPITEAQWHEVLRLANTDLNEEHVTIKKRKL